MVGILKEMPAGKLPDVGQIVGQMNEIRPVREVVVQLVEEYLEASERLEKLNQNA